MFKGALVVIFALTALLGKTTNATVLKVGVPNRIHSLHPLKVSFIQERYILPLVFQPLFQLGVDQSIRPMLVDTYQEIKPGVVRLKIRDNTFFQDGSLIKADDIIKSLSAFCNSSLTGVQTIRSIVGCGRGDTKLQIFAVSPRELDFHIHSSLNYFLYELAAGMIYIFKENGNQVYGSGDYIVSEIKNGNAVLKRTRDTGLEEIQFIYINDADLMKALIDKVIDVGSMYRESDLGTAKFDEFNILHSSSYVTQIMVLNPAIEKMLGEDKIKSIKNRIRELELDQCGLGRVKATGVVPSGVGGHLEELTKNNFKLRINNLKSSKTKLVIYQAKDRSNTCENEKLLQAFHENGIEVEIKLEVDYPDLVKHFGNIEANGYIELFTFTRDAARFFDRFTPDTKQPFFYIKSNQVKEKLTEAMNLKSISDRFVVYKEISKIIENFNTIFPLYYQGHLSVLRKCIVGLPTTESGINLNTFLFLKDLNLKSCQKGDGV